MHISFGLIVAIPLFSTFTIAAHVPRADIQRRNDVGACKAVLIALKASAFCSSFVPITDATVTATQAGSQPTTCVTVTAACTQKKGKRGAAAAPSTTAATTPKISTTPAAPSTTPKITTTPVASTTTPKITTTTASKCSIRGVPSDVSLFACEVIREACIKFVQPRTVTITNKSGSTATSTVTVTPKCTQTTSCSTTKKAPNTTPSTTSCTTTKKGTTTEPSTTKPTTTFMTTTTSSVKNTTRSTTPSTTESTRKLVTAITTPSTTAITTPSTTAITTPSTTTTSSSTTTTTTSSSTTTTMTPSTTTTTTTTTTSSSTTTTTSSSTTTTTTTTTSSSTTTTTTSSSTTTSSLTTTTTTTTASSSTTTTTTSSSTTTTTTTTGAATPTCNSAPYTGPDGSVYPVTCNYEYKYTENTVLAFASADNVQECGAYCRRYRDDGCVASNYYRVARDGLQQATCYLLSDISAGGAPADGVDSLYYDKNAVAPPATCDPTPYTAGDGSVYPVMCNYEYKYTENTVLTAFDASNVQECSSYCQLYRDYGCAGVNYYRVARGDFSAQTCAILTDISAGGAAADGVDTASYDKTTGPQPLTCDGKPVTTSNGNTFSVQCDTKWVEMNNIITNTGAYTIQECSENCAANDFCEAFNFVRITGNGEYRYTCRLLFDTLAGSMPFPGVDAGARQLPVTP